MARDGSGKYVLPAGNPVVPDTVIETGWANPTMSDIANALTSSISSDGQTSPTSNLPMGGYHHTGVSDPTARNQYATLGMTQDGRDRAVSILSGTDNLVGSLVGSTTSYYPGQIISFTPVATNTGPATISINSIAPVSILSRVGKPLVAGDLTAGVLYTAIFSNNGTFNLTYSAGGEDVLARLSSNTTGWVRPESGTYPPLVIASGTQVTVPAGTGRIVPPGQFGFDTVTTVTWGQQTVTITALTTSFSTTLMITPAGLVVQYAGRASAAALRSNVFIGTVSHINGVVNAIQTAPAIYGDDNYLGVDVADALTNIIVSGATVARSGAGALSLDMSGGFALMAGGQANAAATPNYLPIPTANQISFRTLVGSGTVGALVTNAPITQYDNGGVLTTIPGNNDAVTHRLYYIYGEYLWVFGQRVYSSFDAALQRLDQDRSLFSVSPRLKDAVLIAEISCTKATADLATIATCAIMNRGALFYGIGTAGGITDAPADGSTYGRRNNAWSTTISAAAPNMTGNITVTKADPKARLIANPLGAGESEVTMEQGAQKWFAISASPTDDKAYLRSYDPTNSVLRHTTTYDLDTGDWTMPGEVFATGPSLTDATVGRLIPVGAFGLGASAIPVVANLNAVTVSGYYTADNLTTNTPIVGNFTVMHAQGATANAASQLATDLATGTAYIRTLSGGVWAGWQPVGTGAGGGGTMKVERFTTNGTWVKPASVTGIRVLAVAGGQGGTGVRTTSGVSLYGGGGGGGQVILRDLPVTANINIVIGLGGAGGVAPGTQGVTVGAAGGDTVLSGGVTLTVKGGGPAGNGSGASYTAAAVGQHAAGGGGGAGGYQDTTTYGATVITVTDPTTYADQYAPGKISLANSTAPFAAVHGRGGRGVAGFGGGGNGGQGTIATLGGVDGGASSTGPTLGSGVAGTAAQTYGGGGGGASIYNFTGAFNGGAGFNGVIYITWWE